MNAHARLIGCARSTRRRTISSYHDDRANVGAEPYCASRLAVASNQIGQGTLLVNGCGGLGGVGHRGISLSARSTPLRQIYRASSSSLLASRIVMHLLTLMLNLFGPPYRRAVGS